MKAVRSILTVFLLLFTLSFVISTQPVRSQFSGATYIRNDGSVDPATAPIQQVGDTYTLSGNISGNITVQRDNVIVDGGGYTIQGPEINYSATEATIGIDLPNRINVTIKNVQVKSFINGIHLLNSSKNSIIGNNVTENVDGIRLDSSSNNIIIENNVTLNVHGIHPFVSNKFYHNNFIDNMDHVFIRPEDAANSWDNDLPSGGNYWNNYAGADSNDDGIGDTPFTIDANNTDRYPLIALYTSQPDQTSLLPLIVGVVLIIAIIVIGLFFLLRNRRRENSENFVNHNVK
jgi:parallel beta-helix repeat protein